MKYNTRIAPSPTGDMHIGTLRTAYFNYLAARSTGGAFLLRIDDTDKAREKEGAVTTIMEIFQWLNLWPTVVVRQSDRHKIYTLVAEQMLDLGVAKREDSAVMLDYKFPGPYVFKDLVVGDVVISDTALAQAKDLVLLRSDGTPTYHFASVVDDLWFNINLVIRGQDHLSNTPKHIVLMKAMGHTMWPTYAHVGLIHKDGKKLSKRDAAASVLEYKKQGYSPEAVLNFVLRMGWSPSQDNKINSIISQHKAIEMFMTQGAMRGSHANFDQGKLDWYNRKYQHVSFEKRALALPDKNKEQRITEAVQTVVIPFPNGTKPTKSIRQLECKSTPNTYRSLESKTRGPTLE